MAAMTDFSVTNLVRKSIVRYIRSLKQAKRVGILKDDLKLISNSLGEIKAEIEVNEFSYLSRVVFEVERVLLDVVPEGQMDVIEARTKYLKDWVKEIKERGTPSSSKGILATMIGETSPKGKSMVDIGLPSDVLISETDDYKAPEPPDIIIGLEQVTDEIRDVLLQGDPSCIAVVIHGMGGVGKTTLASKIYNSREVTDSFDRRAWVNVGKNHRVQDLLPLILKSLQQDPLKEKVAQVPELATKEEEEDNMVMHLQSELDRRRHLLVIDSVSDIDWKKFTPALLKSMNRSRLIITTRNKRVALHEKAFVQHLGLLNPNDSWELFSKIIALERKKNVSPSKEIQEQKDVVGDNPGMEILAMELVQECCGLPLGIILLARLLSEKEGMEDWLKVKENFWTQLKTQDSQKISELLSLTYNVLSPAVKACFLYMAMFPQGHEFELDKLKHLWAAENLELQFDVEKLKHLKYSRFAKNQDAQKALNELVDRNLIQVTGTLWGNPAKAKLHDVLWYLATNWAKEVGLFDVFDPFKYHSTSLSHDRHAIHGYLQNYVSLSHANAYLRTLLFIKQHREYFEDPKELLSKCMGYKFLRVLYLNGITLGSNQLLNHVIGVFVHLTYLGLANTSISELPASIANMNRLETLDASGNCNCTVPSDMYWPPNLRHLYGHFKGSLNIHGFPIYLHTLKGVTSDQLLLLGPDSAKVLEELHVYHLQDVSSYLDHMASFRYLKTLTIISPRLRHSIEPYSFPFLENLWLDGPIRETELSSFPSSLKGLILSNSSLPSDPMELLQHLPELTDLELVNSYNGNTMFCNPDGFRELKVLRLGKMKNLKELVVPYGAMSKLAGLGIYDCNKLKKPERLAHVTEVAQSEAEYSLQKHRYCFNSYASATSEQETGHHGEKPVWTSSEPGAQDRGKKPVSYDSE